MKLKEVQNHPERLAKTPSPRLALHGSRRVLDQLAVSPSFDVDSFSLKSPPRLAHAHTVNSEILQASLDVSSVNLLQNNPRNPIIAKRNPNIDRMILDNRLVSPRQSPSGDKKLKPTFSSFGLYRSVSCSSTGGSFTLKESTNNGLPQNWSNYASLEDLSLSSKLNLSSNSTTASAATTHSSGSAGSSVSGSSGVSSGTTTTTGSADTNDYAAGLTTAIEEVLTMLNDTTSASSPRTKTSAGEGGSYSSNGSPNGGPTRLSSEPTCEEVKQHQLQTYQSMREVRIVLLTVVD